MLSTRFTVTMASRFEIVDEDYMKEVKDKNGKENMKKTTEYWRRVFKKWAKERNVQANLRPVYTDDFCSDLNRRKNRLCRQAFRRVRERCRSFTHSEIQ